MSQDSPEFHGAALRAAGWDMSGCRSCHGDDYAGGITESSCLTCHSRTPEGCTVCHGTPGDGPGPPEDTHGNSDPAARGVGAHQVHLSTAISASLSCGDCHAFGGFADPAHIDGDGSAEVTFGDRVSAGGFAPVYDSATGSCADTYCHGGGKFGSDAVVLWNGDSAGEPACGTCHGVPPSPDTGHPTMPESLTCDTCHSSVVEVDEQDPTIIRIIDASLHINGEADL